MSASIDTNTPGLGPGYTLDDMSMRHPKPVITPLVEKISMPPEECIGHLSIDRQHGVRTGMGGNQTVFSPDDR